MSRTKLLPLLVLAGTILAVYVVTDALFTTEEERIGAFVEAVTGDVAGDRINSALRYTDPDREPVELSVAGHSVFYDEGDTVGLAESAHRYLEPFLGGNVDLLQERIEIDENHAQVNLRLNTDNGLVNVEFKLNRHSDGWLVHRVRAS
jgi:hypothetical protein